MNGPRQTALRSRMRFAAAIVLPAWLLLALCGSLLGAFDTKHRPPLALAAAAMLPVAAFAIGYFGSAEFRQLVLAANPRLLTLAQTWRVGGVVFLILHQQGVLPAVFALPAGWGDLAVRATAPLMVWAIAGGSRRAKRLFVLWNVLGILDLVMAVTLGVLASASPLGVLAREVTTRPMGSFPLSLIPTFVVPLLIIFHLIALAQVRQARSPLATCER